MKKKTVKKLKLAKETIAQVTGVVGGVTALACNTLQCPTGPNACPQSGKYPC